MNYILKIIGVILIISILVQCKEENKKTLPIESSQKDKAAEVAKKEYKRTIKDIIKEVPEGVVAPEGMVWIPGGKFNQGAVSQDNSAMAHEKPSHEVAVDGFFMDVTEVTNAQFVKFTKETGYITVAEREIDWEEMKKQTLLCNQDL